MAFAGMRSALLLFCIIFISNVTCQSANNYGNYTEGNMCHALQEYRYSSIESYTEKLQDEMSVPELPLEDTLMSDAKCYINSQNSKLLKTVFLPTCAPDEEKRF